MEREETMQIFVGGSLNNVPRDKESCGDFVTALAKAIMEQGHTLLNGCRSLLDKAAAEAAEEWLLKNPAPAGNLSKDPFDRIQSYCLRDKDPIHNIGRICDSELSDWNMSHPDLNPPEQIRDAHVTIFVAGGEGTFWAKNWASYARKPILGIPRFGGAGETIYRQELAKYSDSVPALAQEYSKLNQRVIHDFQTYANEIIARSARVAVPRSVFAIMSFKKEFNNVYASYQAACDEFDFQTVRTDDPNSPQSNDRILPRIELGIRQSAIVIADVSEASLNVFYELGFAKALGKDVIVTAREGTDIPFDIRDLPVLYWRTQPELKQKLRTSLSTLKRKYGI